MAELANGITISRLLENDIEEEQQDSAYSLDTEVTSMSTSHHHIVAEVHDTLGSDGSHHQLPRVIHALKSPEEEDRGGNRAVAMVHGAPKIDWFLKGSFAEKIHHKCHSTPDKNCFVWLDSRGEEEATLSFKQVWSRAAQIAYHLQHKHSCKAGDKILLVFLPGLEFHVSFVACIIAGFVAVPCYPPTPADLNRSVHRTSFMNTFHLLTQFNIVNCPSRCLTKMNSICSSIQCKVALTHSRYNKLRQALQLKARFGGEQVWLNNHECVLSVL